jgi:AcrR family transcriptional regulator
VPRPKQRTPELRHHVLSTAVGLLDRDGVAGFTARGVAREAHTSTPAVYELFGDKGGLLREVYFEGFRMLRREMAALTESDDSLADLLELARIYRAFIGHNRALAEAMFSRPFTEFDPGPSELQASSSVRIFVVSQVRRCLVDGRLQGDETDIAHALVSLVQGLAAAENAQRLGTSQASIDRRWDLAVRALLRGLSGGSPATRR